LSIDEGLHIEASAYGSLGLVHFIFIPRKKRQMTLRDINEAGRIPSIRHSRVCAFIEQVKRTAARSNRG
jgi:hypothetical protein